MGDKKMARSSVYMEKWLYNEFKKHCIDKGMTITALMEKLVKAELGIDEENEV